MLAMLLGCHWKVLATGKLSLSLQTKMRIQRLSPIHSKLTNSSNYKLPLSLRDRESLIPFLIHETSTVNYSQCIHPKLCQRKLDSLRVCLLSFSLALSLSLSLSLVFPMSIILIYFVQA